jgi:hypothetical protein
MGGKMSEATIDTLHEQVASAESGVVTPTLKDRVRERPFLSLALAGLAGFVFGGGAASRTGAATLMLVARIWLRRAATNALSNAITGYGRAKQNGSA